MNAINELRIGNVTIPNRVALAPMAGVCDLTYRRLAKEMGVGLICTEMVSAKGIMYENERTCDLLKIDPTEHPVSLQIFGNDPQIMAEAAKVVESTGADIVDINMGCPVQKVVRNGEGSALMKDVALAARIVGAMVQAVRIPVTAKIRIGWDDELRNAVEVARALEAAGVAALTVHGRTRQQMYDGKADWQAIAEVVDAVRIPVWGNGDVVDGPSAAKMLRETGCAGVAVGRAAQGNPFVFREIIAYLSGEDYTSPTALERLAMCQRHLHELAAEKGEYVAVREMRTHAMGYLKGLPGAAAQRRRLSQLNSLAAWDLALEDMMDFFRKSDPALL